MIKLIAAISKNGVIGKDNKLPFDYPEDMAHFRKSTANSTIIMGRKTFESIGNKPLPKRRNIIISSTIEKMDNVEIFPTLEEALKTCYDMKINITTGNYDQALKQPVWLIGGRTIYKEGLDKQLVDELCLTIMPDEIEGDNLTLFPWFNSTLYTIKENRKLTESSNLDYVVYEKITKVI